MNIITKITYGTLLTLAVTACSTVDPYTGEEKTSSATRGAITGGILGGIFAASRSDGDPDDVAKGILVGAAIGGTIGNYYDQQEAALRERLQGTGISVTRVSETEIRLNMPSDITFAVDSDTISSSFYRILDDVALVLSEFSETQILVEGHTDSTGSDGYNQSLSQRRAATVTGYLVRQGVNAGRLASLGYGESRPIASNDTEAGRALNRRVEIQIAN